MGNESVAPPILTQFAAFAPCYGKPPPPPSPPPAPPGPASPLTCKTTEKGNAAASLPCKEVFAGDLCVEADLIGVGQHEPGVDACYEWCSKSTGCTFFALSNTNDTTNNWCIRYAGCTPRNDSRYTTYKMCSVPGSQ